MHSWDLTEGNEGSLSTIWGDTKIQLTTRDNEINQMILSLGLF